MRSDMGKVVTERPRRGGGLKQPKGIKKREYREMKEGNEQHSEKIRRKWKEHYTATKEFTDVLGPLYGYLLKQVGRPWNDVWSEICKNLPKNNTNLSHVRDHVFDFVHLHVNLIDGIPYDRLERRWSSGQYPISSYRDNWALYVHPETGILCKFKEKEKKRHKEKPSYVEVPDSPNQQYHKINGAWFILTLEERNWEKKGYRWSYIQKKEVETIIQCYHFDFSEQKQITRSQAHNKYGKPMICVAKRQLSSRDIKKAGLK